MQTILVALIVFVAVLTQTLVGFGTAMVGMPLLVGVIGIQTASPLVALLGLTLEVILVLRYRASLDLRVIWRLIAAAFVGIPLGILALQRIDEQIVLTALGVLIIVYAVYGLLNLKLPELNGNGWSFGLGFASGVLGGAYNTAGPPVVVYGHCRRWSPDEFRVNLQSFFLAVDLIVVINHAFAGNLTPDVWRTYLLSLLPLVAAFLVGIPLAKRINPAAFSRIVLVMLIFLGLRLIF